MHIKCDNICKGLMLSSALTNIICSLSPLILFNYILQDKNWGNAKLLFCEDIIKKNKKQVYSHIGDVNNMNFYN
jgi:hypothetical protein